MTPPSQLADPEHLWQAWKRAARGKRGTPSVARFEARLEENLHELATQLASRTYRPAGYHSFRVRDTKTRWISAAPFRDRVVHHALCQLTEPRWTRLFSPASFANQVGKGTHAALDHAQRLLRRHPFVLSCDVREYFARVDHAILLDTLDRYSHEDEIRWLNRLILASGADVHQVAPEWFPGDDLMAANRPKGLPIGNLTSQFWANAYLHPIDQMIQRELRVPGYVRYVDDLLLFGPDKPSLWQWHARLVERLARRRLRLHPAAQVRPAGEGTPFLGFVLTPHTRRLKSRNAVAATRRFRAKYLNTLVDPSTTRSFVHAVEGWCAHAKHGNTIGIRKALLRRITQPPDTIDPRPE